MKKVIIVGTILCLLLATLVGCGYEHNAYAVNPTSNPNTTLEQTEQSEQSLFAHTSADDLPVTLEQSIVSPAVTLDEAIAETLQTSQYLFLMGEFFSSAYHVLQIDEVVIDENITEITVYLLATHGWYNRATGLDIISGSGIVYGVLVLTRENDLYKIQTYNEYDYKQLYPLGNIFPVDLVEYAQANLDKYFAALKEEEQNKVIAWLYRN